MDRRERVLRAIAFQQPDRTPLWLFNRECFMVPISYQTESISGTPAEIAAEACRLHGLYATDRGGYIGYVEEYGCMGMSEENYQACVRAFQALP